MSYPIFQNEQSRSLILLSRRLAAGQPMLNPPSQTSSPRPTLGSADSISANTANRPLQGDPRSRLSLAELDVRVVSRYGEVAPDLIAYGRPQQQDNSGDGLSVFSDDSDRPRSTDDVAVDGVDMEAVYAEQEDQPAQQPVGRRDRIQTAASLQCVDDSLSIYSRFSDGNDAFTSRK